MNVIRIIFVERLLFDNDVKEALERMFKRNGIKFSYYDGYIVRFEKTNVYSITTHRIVFSRNECNLLVLYYDEYHKDDDVFYVDGEKYILNGIKSYVRNYFISKTSKQSQKISTKNNTKRPKIGL